MTDEEKNGLLKNICVSEDKLEDYLNAITDDCKFIGKDGGCELYFHEPDERKHICLICRDYESNGHIEKEGKP